MGWGVSTLMCLSLVACGADEVGDADRATLSGDVQWLVEQHTVMLSARDHATVLAEGWVPCDAGAGAEHGEAFTHVVDLRPQPEGVHSEEYPRDLARSNLESSRFTSQFNEREWGRQVFHRDGYEMAFTVIEGANIVVLEGSSACVATVDDLPEPLDRVRDETSP